MVSKLDKQTYTGEFESHWVPYTSGLVPHLSKKLSKLLQHYWDSGLKVMKVFFIIYTI